MEYFIGSVFTLVLIVVVRKFIINKITYTIRPAILNQTRIFELTKDTILTMLDSSVTVNNNTQAHKHFDSVNLRILFFEKQAYWIKENKLFVADIVDGEVDGDTTKEVDTMSMDNVELERTVFIVEQLTEGLDNDRGNSGKP